MPAIQIQLTISGLLGACGVMLLAAGSHTAGGLATTAGQMLLFHAPAIMAAATTRKAGLLHPTIGLAAIWILAAGVSIFAADMAVRALLGWPRLFPMAAPTGGTLTILGWVVLTLAAILNRNRA